MIKLTKLNVEELEADKNTVVILPYEMKDSLPAVGETALCTTEGDLDYYVEVVRTIQPFVLGDVCLITLGERKIGSNQPPLPDNGLGGEMVQHYKDAIFVYSKDDIKPSFVGEIKPIHVVQDTMYAWVKLKAKLDDEWGTIDGPTRDVEGFDGAFVRVSNRK